MDKRFVSIAIDSRHRSTVDTAGEPKDCLPLSWEPKSDGRVGEGSEQTEWKERKRRRHLQSGVLCAPVQLSSYKAICRRNLWRRFSRDILCKAPLRTDRRVMPPTSSLLPRPGSSVGQDELGLGPGRREGGRTHMAWNWISPSSQMELISKDEKICRYFTWQR